MTSNSRSKRCLAKGCPILAEDAFPAVGPACPLPEPAPCCQTDSEPSPTPEPPCCCKASMAEALRLLCDPTLAFLVDFDAFFFLTDHLAIGGELVPPNAEGVDNIGAVTAAFRRFSPCNCDLLDVTGPAYFAAPAATATALESITQLNLCAVKAAAFQLTPPPADTPANTPTPYQQATRAIRRAIQAEGGDTRACGTCAAHCDCDNCCCNAGILAELSTRNLSRLATLTAGALVLRNVTVLGSLGSVLVLSDETTGRFYLVCASAVEALG